MVVTEIQVAKLEEQVALGPVVLVQRRTRVHGIGADLDEHLRVLLGDEFRHFVVEDRQPSRVPREPVPIGLVQSPALVTLAEAATIVRGQRDDLDVRLVVENRVQVLGDLPDHVRV